METQSFICNFGGKLQTNRFDMAKGKNRGWIIGLCGVVAGVVVTLALTDVYHRSSSNETCFSCHVHPESDANWKLSVHYNNASGTKTDCEACHLPPRGSFARFKAKAHMGDDATAASLLNELRALRNATATQTIGSSLIEEIVTERRKELYGEGFAWFDIIRLQKGLTREGNHSNFGGKTPVPARSWRFVYQIPTNEINNNPNINSTYWPNGDQNPFGDVSICLE